jgi:hypothetical protein
MGVFPAREGQAKVIEPVRPGKLRFLIGVKNLLPIGRPRPPDNTAPCGAAPFARFATSVGLHPPSVTHPATFSHPDCRAILILFVAHHLSARLAFSACVILVYPLRGFAGLVVALEINLEIGAIENWTIWRGRGV